jgi:Tfp pilus assembly protein PilP
MKPLTVMLVAGLSMPLAAQTAATPQAAATTPATPAMPSTPSVIPLGSRVGQTPSGGYEDGGRRDPFSSLIVAKRNVSSPGAMSDGSRARTGIGSISLSDVAVRGIVKSGTTMLAILEGPNKQSFVTRVKDRLADATVVAVEADGVVFAEQLDPGMAPSQVRKSLRPAGEGIR